MYNSGIRAVKLFYMERTGLLTVNVYGEINHSESELYGLTVIHNRNYNL